MNKLAHALWMAAALAAALPGAAVAQTNAEATAAPASPTSALVGDLEAVLGTLADRHIEVNPEAARRAVFECVARTADPQARLFTADAYAHWNEELRGLDFHPGVLLTMTNAVPCVREVTAQGTPLQPGDLLLAADGVALTNSTIVEADARLRGHSAAPVSLLVRRGEAVLTVDVARALSPLPALANVEEWPQGIGYIRLNGLYENSGRDVADRLRAWAEAGRFGFVLDLRGAGGGDLASVTPLAGSFATPGSLLYAVRDRQDQDLEVAKAPAGAPLDTPIMVLVNRATVGAAEVLAAVMADSVRGALLVGEATGADPLVREASELPGGDLLYLATRRVVTAGGLIYDGARPVAPDLVVSPAAGADDRYETAGGPDRRATLDVELGDRALRDRIRGDAALRRALDVLLGLKALNIRAGGVSSP